MAFMLLGNAKQTEFNIRLAPRITLACLMLSESKAKKILEVEQLGPITMETIRSALEVHVLPEILYPLMQVKQ